MIKQGTLQGVATLWCTSHNHGVASASQSDPNILHLHMAQIKQHGDGRNAKP